MYEYSIPECKGIHQMSLRKETMKSIEGNSFSFFFVNVVIEFSDTILSVTILLG